MNIQAVCSKFCAENGVPVYLSNEMPSGYETAYGTYDVTINTLFLNLPLLQSAPDYEVLFYIYHELRHAVQYLHPERFEKTIQESLPYVILYDGGCFRLIDNSWQECVLPGNEEYFTNAYLSLPYELDANHFAYQTVKSLLGDSSELEEIYNFWLPKIKCSCDELKLLFRMIDKMVGLGSDCI